MRLLRALLMVLGGIAVITVGMVASTSIAHAGHPAVALWAAMILLSAGVVMAEYGVRAW